MKLVVMGPVSLALLIRARLPEAVAIRETPLTQSVKAI